MIAQGWNPETDARALRAAMKGFGTDEKTLIRVLAPLDPLQAVTLRQAYGQIHPGRDLVKDIESETSRYFEEALIAIVRGPLVTDAYNVRTAVKGAGTNEDLLNHVVLGRSNADLRAIKETYQREFKRRLEDDVDGDLSMKTKDLFRIVLRAERAPNSAPAIPHQIDRDVAEMHRALTSMGEQLAVCNILALRSDGQIRAMSQAYEQRHRKPLRDVLNSKFDGHMQSALLLMFDRACDPIMSDAVQLEAAMAGMGTKDRLLVNRVVTTHWNRAHKDQVKRAYQHRYKKDLIKRIEGETSGDYCRLLVACMQ
jgi:annexin A7/11